MFLCLIYLSLVAPLTDYNAMLDSKSPSRRMCFVCSRPQSHCLCGYISPVHNHTRVIILQHPEEKKHPLNTARLAKLGLSNVELVIGEQFLHLKDLTRDFDSVFLLFPATEKDSTYPLQPLPKTKTSLLFVPDGTWRQVRQIMRLNPLLESLTRISLPVGQPSEYRVRKARETAAVSTIEAIARTLTVLEPDIDFEPLLTPFRQLVNQQIQSMGKATFSKNYRM